MNEGMQSEWNEVSSQAVTASPPDNDNDSSVHPSTDLPEKKKLSEMDPPDDNADPEQVQPPVEPPPDGGYGWVCVLCVFLINTHTWGINSSYGVFLAHYLDTNTFPGASDLHFAFIGGLSLSLAQFIAPVATITTREWGTRSTLLIGIVLQTGALLGASFATTTWHLFLSQAICFGFGMGMQFSATVGIIPQWFSTRRSLANGIGTSGSGIGGLIYSLASNAIISQHGTPWAFRILAIVSASACGVSALLIRDRNHAIGAVQLAFHTTLLQRPEFLLTLTWGSLSVLGYVALLFSIPSYATTIGLSASQGSILGAMFNLGGGIGRPVIGYISDIFGRLNTALICTFLAGLFAFVIWIPARGFGVLIFYALLGGTVSATFTTTVAPVAAEVVGLKVLPSALSIFWLSVVVPSTFAEPIALWLRTENGTEFLHAQIFTGVMFMGGAGALWLVRGWKVEEIGRNGGLEKEGEDGGDGDADAGVRQPVVARTVSRASVASKARAVKGLFALGKV